MLVTPRSVSGTSTVPLTKMAEVSNPDPDQDVININDEDDWQDIGPANIEEARAYLEKVDMVFKNLNLLLQDDRKDVLASMVNLFKKLAAKHW